MVAQMAIILFNYDLALSLRFVYIEKKDNEERKEYAHMLIIIP